MVPLGQATRQGASSQCRHWRGNGFPSRKTLGTVWGLSTIAVRSSLEADPISVPHQSSHWWHPVHLLLSTIRTFTFSSSNGGSDFRRSGSISRIHQFLVFRFRKFIRVQP